MEGNPGLSTTLLWPATTWRMDYAMFPSRGNVTKAGTIQPELFAVVAAEVTRLLYVDHRAPAS